MFESVQKTGEETSEGKDDTDLIYFSHIIFCIFTCEPLKLTDRNDTVLHKLLNLKQTNINVINPDSYIHTVLHIRRARHVLPIGGHKSVTRKSVNYEANFFTNSLIC